LKEGCLNDEELLMDQSAMHASHSSSRSGDAQEEAPFDGEETMDNQNHLVLGIVARLHRMKMKMDILTKNLLLFLKMNNILTRLVSMPLKTTNKNKEEQEDMCGPSSTWMMKPSQIIFGISPNA
jgi:hypothetical protein